MNRDELFVKIVPKFYSLTMKIDRTNYETELT